MVIQSGFLSGELFDSFFFLIQNLREVSEKHLSLFSLWLSK
jgi:hypothetical protein